MTLSAAPAQILLKHQGYLANGRGLFMRSATTDALERRARWSQSDEESNSEYFGELDDQERVEDDEL